MQTKPAFFAIAAMAWLACTVTSTAHADVIRYTAAPGSDVVYLGNQPTYRVQPNAPEHGVITVYGDDTQSAPPSVQLQQIDIRPTAWAAPIVRRQHRPDVASIRAAKTSVQLMDEERRQRRLEMASRD